MSQKFLVDINLAGNRLLNALLDTSGGGTDLTPATANKAQIYYNTTGNLVKVSNGTSLDTLTNLLESVGVGTANGLSVSAISAKNQNISLALASGASAGAMSTTHYNLVNGATSANTVSTLVQRDGSGNFSAGTITASLTGTASNATQLNSQAASYYLARANHTGTQLAATISDFDTQVRTSRLDQMASPTASVSFNSQKITSLLDPTNPQDAATKNYVDSVATGLDFKQSVRVATTADLGATYTATAGTSGRGQLTAAPNTVDGVTLVNGNRVLVKNQTTGAQNGIYVVTTVGTGSNGTWDRATDFDQDVEVTSGAFTFVEEGTANDNSGWVLGTNNPITIGGSSGTSLTWVQFSGTGAGFSAGNGITIIGGVIAVKVDTTTTNANSLSVSSNGVTIATSYVGQTSITTLGTITTGTWNGTTIAVANGGTGATTAAGARTNLGASGKFAQTLSTSSTSYTVNHNLNTTDVDVTVKEISTSALVGVDVVVTDANNVTVSFATAPSANAYRVTVFG